MSSVSVRIAGRSFVPPVFLPDATFGVVRSVDAEDLRRCGIGMLMMNTFHLMRKPGATTVQALGGLHGMAGWDGPIATDSGGFQAYSLIRQNPKYGRIDAKGLLFVPESGDRKLKITPEKSIQLQVRFGADLLFCLDDCTHTDDPASVQRESVTRTIAWGRQCRAEFDRLMGEKRVPFERRPALYGIVQGGGSEVLRRQCAEALLEIGFDGYGFGGWPLDRTGALLTDQLALVRSLIPPNLPLHALGVGHPVSVAACTELGYTQFDSALPTRDARHGRLYRFRPGVPVEPARGGDWFEVVYVADQKYMKDDRPVDETCDCLCCRTYSLGYLNHLNAINEVLFQRLATVHNLAFMARLTAGLADGDADTG